MNDPFLNTLLAYLIGLGTMPMIFAVVGQIWILKAVFDQQKVEVDASRSDPWRGPSGHPKRQKGVRKGPKESAK